MEDRRLLQAAHAIYPTELLYLYGKITLLREFNGESEEEILDNSNNPNDDLLFCPLELIRRCDFIGFVSCLNDQRRIFLRT